MVFLRLVFFRLLFFRLLEPPSLKFLIFLLGIKFIEQKNDAQNHLQDGLNILVDFLEDNKGLFNKGLSNISIISIINILRELSFDEINIPFKLIVKYYDWNNLFITL